jgi:hypothetical protein
MSKSTKKSSGTKTSAKPAKREKKSMADHQTAAAAAALIDAGQAMDTPAVDADRVPLTEVMKKPAKGAKAPKAPKAEKPVKTPKAEKPARKPSGLDAAAKVLADKGEPMRCGDIVETMINTGLWETNGKTPAATIYAAILREITVKGAEARFKKTDRGLFTINGK